MRGALGLVTYDSRVFLGSSGGAEMLSLIRMLVCGGRRHHEPHYGAVSVAWMELLRQEDGFDDKGGERLAVDGRGREGLNCP